jgi:hypothetical protein
MPIKVWTGDEPVLVEVHGEGPFLTVPIQQGTEVSRRER